MVEYRRNYVQGGTFFFTTNLRDRRSTLLVQEIDLLREATRKVRTQHPFEIVAAVVLPDHLHTIWTLQQGDADYALRWRLIKTTFTKAVARRGSRRDLWQDRYWEHTIRSDTDLQRHIEYIHWNPVKHGHVSRASDWPHSSIHRYISGGVIPADWASELADGDFGERPD